MLKGILTHLNAWLRESQFRWVFLCSLISGLVIFGLSFVWQILFLISMLLFIVATFCSIMDSMCVHDVFKREIAALELRDRVKQIQDHGTLLRTTCFTDDEARYIRRRKKAYIFSFIAKTIIIIILIAFIINNGI